MATKNDDASSSADSPDPVLEDEQHRGIVDEKRVRDMKRKASLNYYDWPIEKKGSKKRRTCNNECAKLSEQIALQGAMMIEMANRRYEGNRLRSEINTLRDEVDMLRYEVDTLRHEATLREMELQQPLDHVCSYKRCVP
ncbi:uncharacterized protein LOC103941517 isoform X1 [Pyrus x bretschneideri]|uniref:uncharacterized protein LOC103941517 isoform X1 n=1 Tax=Pyrus x bretschneideri TaxID=225117 RepID=UPI00202F0F95|nr:uncharacterized protein LOC103941517 isoform X1 [Pyrus x bretschneideri]XP_048431249.1 uncharacterized protein LOC103941517 isoform X1 [Pyrus x bretschneideri]